MLVSFSSLLVVSLLVGWLLDLLLGDPRWLPHPVVGFGKMIAFGEHRLNRGRYRMLKGGVMAIGLIALVFLATWLLRHLLFSMCSSCDSCSSCLYNSLSCYSCSVFDAIVIFFCLAGTTLIREVKAVFAAVDRSLEEGRRQVARIVGRDTAQLSAQEVRTAALETLAENLSDGVIAPLFWLALLGTPGMLAYKMVNTLDSMIGYRSERYRLFGCVAARIDDVANYIPARLTALLMIVGYKIMHIAPCTIHHSQRSTANGQRSKLISFVLTHGPKHASPNSGWPEAALAGILDCRFGGSHNYFGQQVYKPYIGTNDRLLTTADMRTATRVNRTAEVLMVVLVGAALAAYTFITSS